MSKINDGGAAFPCDRPLTANELGERTNYSSGCDRSFQEGMSLRDWFAGMALQGMIASNAPANSAGYGFDRNGTAPNEAYRYADAMLAAREVQS